MEAASLWMLTGLAIAVVLALRMGMEILIVRPAPRLAAPDHERVQEEQRIVHHGARSYTVARGEQLVRRALEDRVL